MTISHIRQREMGQLHEAVGFGLLNFLFAVETAGKRNCPVRGGHRSFAPADPKKSGHQIGGTLRRSVHTEVFVDGHRISPESADENGKALPVYAADKEIVGYVGTNSGYGLWVHDGTVKMPARPFIVEGFNEERGSAQQLIAAGSRKHLGQ